MLCRRGFANNMSDFRGSGIFRGLFVLGMAGLGRCAVGHAMWRSISCCAHAAGDVAKDAAKHGGKQAEQAKTGK